MKVWSWTRGHAASLAGVMLATAALVSPALVSPVQAAVPQVSPWVSCDGYGKPSKGGDGMTEYATVLAIFSPPGYGTTDRKQQARGASAVALCDAALADTPDTHWRRRANLLRARGLHRLESAESAGVLEDFDLAQSVGQPGVSDPFFQRSQALGLDIARAYALRRLDRPAEGRVLAVKTADERPYARSPLMAARLALGPQAAPADVEKVTRTLARLSPDYRGELFIDAFEQGDFATVVGLYPYLSAGRPPNRNERDAVVLAVEGLRFWASTEAYWAEANMTYAYALAAQGRSAEARAALAAAKTRIETARPPLPTDPKPRFDVVRTGAATIRDTTSREGQAALASWTDLIERRIQVTEGHADVVLAGLAAHPLPGNGAGADLLASLAASMPEGAAPAIKAVADLRAKLRARLRQTDHDYADALFPLLPEAETRARLTAWREASFLSGFGYRQTLAANGEATVHFRGALSSGAMIEEMALLRAAQVALKEGRHAFVLLNRSDIDWTTVTYYMGMPLRDDPGGFETEIVVRFVDPKTSGAPPWLVLDADAIQAALAPLYLPATAALETRAGAGAP